jgi:hypothetical protein
MNWKTTLQVRDLEPHQRLEMTCRTCGHVHYLTKPQIMTEVERGYLYLDELERQTCCRARGCHGAVRLAIVRTGETSAFVGGMA